MDLGLAGSVAVVTGAGAGIGLATARALLAEGAIVVGGDRDAAALRGAGADALELDLLEPSAPARLVAHALERHGAVDVLVNSLGGLERRPGGFTAVDDAGWTATFELNVMVAVRAIRSALPPMLAGGGGAIVSIASDQAREPDPLFVDYAAAKAALVVVSRAVAQEYAASGVRSNVVSPGPTRTPGFVEGFAAGAGSEPVEAVIDRFVTQTRRIPLARLGRAEEVAAVAVFLASAAAANVTGSEYRVDGGLVHAA